MIGSFKSKPLKRLCTRNDAAGIRADWIDKVTLVLDRLDASTQPQQLNLPGFRFPSAHGRPRRNVLRDGLAQLAITFRWDGEDALDIDLEDYHG